MNSSNSPTDRSAEPQVAIGEHLLLSRKALLSLVFGILAFLCPCITGLPAIILAALALRDIGRNRDRLAGKGMAVAGLLLGIMAIVLLGVAIAAIAVSVSQAVKKARAASVKAEIMQLEQAIEFYKNQYGDYPPNLANPEAALRHTMRVHPRWMRESATPPPTGGDAAQSLVFWLSGFNRDPRDPLRLGGDRTAPLFDFDETRLRDGRYYPPDSNEPYVYFRGGKTGLSGESLYGALSSGTLKPYQQDGGSEYVNPGSFQIIAAGQDDSFGTGGEYPSGNGYAEADFDNVANFTRGVTLNDDMPCR